MQEIQTNKPVKLNVDASPKYLPADSSHYILNQEVSVNPNGGANNGASVGKSTPMAGNYPACEIDQPSGENYATGRYESKRTNETYSWVHNSNGVHYVQRISGDGTCQIVYVGDCLSVSAAPRHSIEQFKAGMRVEKICKNWSGKELVWVDGDIVSPGCLDVEASIATNFFTTPFFDICPDPCAYIQLCVPEICGCITAEFLPLQANETTLSNYIKEKGFKFMAKHVYYDGRASEWSDWSSLYYQQTECLTGVTGIPRCLKLRIPAGNPMVEKIVVAFSEDGGATWYEYETIEKYKAYNNTQQQWYDRQLSEEVVIGEDCAFDYIFCNDKNRKTIDATEVSRVRNPIPRKAQTMFNFAGKFAFFNYEDGICPLPKTETEKLSVGIVCDESIGCITEMVEVIVRAIIYQPIARPGLPGIAEPSTGLVFRMGGDTPFAEDNPEDTAYFGGQWRLIPEIIEASSQRFYDRTRNFIVYVEGTEYWAEMKQWRAGKFFTNRTLVGVEPRISSAQIIDLLINQRGFYYQEAKLKVPKGSKGFIRMVSNEASDGAGDRQDTSVGIFGILNNINTFETHIGLTEAQYPLPDARIGVSEIYFDTCNGNFENNEAFLVNDTGGGSRLTGYIKDLLGRPIEGLRFYTSRYANQIHANFAYLVTDHNGFYVVNVPESEGIDIYGETDCNVWGIVKSITLLGIGGSTRTDIIIDDPALSYSTSHFSELDVLVTDCHADPLPNVKVVISGSKSKETDAFGIAKLIVRNYKGIPRFVKILVANSGSCINSDCSNNCNPCMDEINLFTPSCYSPTPIINAGSFRINQAAVQNKNGLKPGGFYKWAFRGKGDCGRVSAAYEFQEMNVPRLQETLGYKFCHFSYDGTGMQLPSWVKCIEILRTENLNSYELQWIVDKVERTIGGDIKLTFQSLNDYNTRFFDRTNSVYQYLKGDRVEFISNDGKILDASVYGILNYLVLSPFHDTFYSGKLDAPADYFNQILIKDDGKLSMIKEGAIIEFQRPKQAKAELNPYFDICAVIPTRLVDNGDGTSHTELENPTGSFNTFDTYFIRRNIAGYIENFQHHSPSDFWGTRLTDAGRAFFINKYENEKRLGRNVTVNSPTQLNYFGDIIKKFDGDEQGDITAVNIVDDSVLMIISEQDNSVAEISNDFLRVDRTGIVRALPTDDIISNPQPKLAGAYGCQYDQVGSVFFFDGGATWWDANRMAYVVNDYRNAQDVSLEKFKSYIQQTTQQVLFDNSNAVSDLDKYRFVTGQNNQTKTIFITVKTLRESGINNEKGIYNKKNRTLLFNPLVNESLGFASFTPEGISNLNLSDDAGCTFVTYLNAIPYIHPVIADKWNEFYGVAVDWMLGISVNKFPDKEKTFLAMQQQSETAFIIDRVETDKTNYLSEIPPKAIVKSGRHWDAGFKGNINSRQGLHGNELPTGYYAKILLIRDNSLNLAYNTTDNQKRTKYSELDTIITKMVMSEESGYTSNI